ncbi:hypothetical protein [Actinoplanes sp. HUAS TT8]|uniref:hypothetical protein n=1 Tax=Actinoplanes sp. HUAS TT8 TaxID=3447453 RepID=UPI003F51D653
MTVPTITITMVGGQHSGKTVFLHALYAMLSAGVDELALLTVDPDQDTLMMRAWLGMKERGIRLTATDGEQRKYRFWLTDGFDTIADLDIVDFRGSAMIAASGPDAPVFRERLVGSDCIVMVLNGEHLRAHLAGSPGSYSEELRQIGTNVRRALRDRHDAGRPDPSLIVMITKADLLHGLGGATLRETMTRIEQELPDLVTVIGVPGATVLVCPVTVGDIGEREDTFTAADVRPRHMERPLIYALVRLLEAEIARRTAALPPAPIVPVSASPPRMTLVRAMTSLLSAQLRWARAAAPALPPDLALTREAELAALAQVGELTTRLRSRLRGMTVFVDGERTEIV